MNVKLLAIKAAIYDMGLKFNQEPSDAKITAYAKELMDYTPEQINFAFKQTILSGSAFFPSLAEILAHLKPKEEKPEDLAPGVANEMIQLIRSYSSYDEKRMIENASEYARKAFYSLGNTQDLRNSENFETMKAQLERTIRSVISSESANKKSEKLRLVGIETKPLEFKTMDYSNFLPSEPA